MTSDTENREAHGSDARALADMPATCNALQNVTVFGVEALCWEGHILHHPASILHFSFLDIDNYNKVYMY